MTAFIREKKNKAIIAIFKLKFILMHLLLQKYLAQLAYEQ